MGLTKNKMRDRKEIRYALEEALKETEILVPGPGCTDVHYDGDALAGRVKTIITMLKGSKYKR